MKFYKFKMVGEHWFVLFDKNGEKEFIYDDVDSLKEYVTENKDTIFVGGENYKFDNIMIDSIFKDNGLEDVSMPLSIDVTQEIVRTDDVKLDNCLLNMNGKVFNYNISDNLDDEDLGKIIGELRYKIDFIKELYSERKDYFDWRLRLVKEFDLPIECVTYSKAKLMEAILSFNGNKMEDVKIDSNLQKYIDNMPELQELVSKVLNSGINGQSVDFGNTKVNIKGFGLKASCDKVVDTTGDNNYLYIDFNSFGPSMIINNGWLNGIVDYPERYEQLRDRRIKLKAEHDNVQKYYKGMINSLIGQMSSLESVGYNPNVIKSQIINGVLVMYFLYKQIERFGVEVIEVNTDGMIIKSPKKFNEEISSIVKNLCTDLNMSCDVDPIRKIVHRNIQSYCVEFDDGTIKEIGVFNRTKKEMFQTSSKRYLAECLSKYYLENENDIKSIINELVSRNDPTIFQEIINKTTKTNPLYVIQDGELVELTSSSNRLIVVKDESRNPIFKLNADGNLVPYNSKVNFELVNDGLNDFDMNRLDLDYYFEQVKKNIEATSGRKVAMLDIDGTLVEDLNKEKILLETLKKMKIKVSDEDFSKLNKELDWAYLSFMSSCKKEKGFGTIEHFAFFCKERCSCILGENIDYDKFAETYFKVEESIAKRETKVFEGVEEGIRKLREQGFDIAIYTNGIPLVQKAKLKHVPLSGKIVHMGDLSNSYAKSSKKGFLDQLEQLKLDLSVDTVIMVGNGSSDLVPKTLNIPTYILLNGRDESELSKTIRIRAEKDENVNVVSDMREVPKMLLKKPIRKNI